MIRRSATSSVEGRRRRRHRHGRLRHHLLQARRRRCHGRWGMGNNSGSALFRGGTSPSGDFAFVIHVKGFSSGWIVHHFPIGRELFLFLLTIVRVGRRRQNLLFDPIVGCFPLRLSGHAVGVKGTTRLWVDALHPPLSGGRVGAHRRFYAFILVAVFSSLYLGCVLYDCNCSLFLFRFVDRKSVV